MTAIPLGDPRPLGESVCGFGLTESRCERPATFHIWLFDEDCSLIACDEHFATWIQPHLRPSKNDVHAFGGVCNMPGTIWHFSTPDGEGFCTFPIPEHALEVVEEQVLVGASA